MAVSEYMPCVFSYEEEETKDNTYHKAAKRCAGMCLENHYKREKQYIALVQPLFDMTNPIPYALLIVLPLE